MSDILSLDLITALLLTTLASIILAISSHTFNFLEGSELPLTYNFLRLYYYYFLLLYCYNKKDFTKFTEQSKCQLKD
jgi:hypothetical protein